MRAVIIGAGNAGNNLAVKLCQENHDVIVIDQDERALNEVEAQLDILTVKGHGCNPRVLREAEIRKADLLMAVTNCDDVNILACSQAAQAGVRHKVARISGTDYLSEDSDFDLKALGVDLAVNPLLECAKEILNNLRLPGSQEVIDLMGGRVRVIGIRVTPTSPLLEQTPSSFPRPDLLQMVRFIAVIRDNNLIIPSGKTVFQAKDEVYIVGSPDKIPAFLDWACPDRPQLDRVVIAGGGDIGIYLAQSLDDDRHIQTFMVEADAEKATAAATRLNHTMVIQGDPLSAEVLSDIGITATTAFVGCLQNEEYNVIASLLARKYGAGMTIIRVPDPEFVPIINNLSNNDRAVSTHLSMINSILHYMRGRHIESAAIMHMLPGELLEVNLKPKTRWAGKLIRDLQMPDGALIATVLRGEQFFLPTGSLTLLEDDRLLIFSTPQALKKLNRILRK